MAAAVVDSSDSTPTEPQWSSKVQNKPPNPWIPDDNSTPPSFPNPNCPLFSMNATQSSPHCKQLKRRTENWKERKQLPQIQLCWISRFGSSFNWNPRRKWFASCLFEEEVRAIAWFNLPGTLPTNEEPPWKRSRKSRFLDTIGTEIGNWSSSLRPN